MNATDAEGAADRSSNSQNKRNTLSNPSVVAIFSSGLVVLLAIGITGCCVLQRGQMYWPLRSHQLRADIFNEQKSNSIFLNKEIIIIID